MLTRMNTSAEQYCLRVFCITSEGIEKEARERSFLTEGAQTRYLGFVESYPDLEKRIHNFHIASYLGISHVTLSRIRGEIRKSND